VRTVPRDPDGGDADVAEIAALVEELGALEAVVGLPRTLAGEEGAAARAARTYAGRLAERIAPVPVRLVDERLTTVDAHRSLRESGVDGRRQRAVVDQAAAVLILQAALDAERGSGRPPGELVRTGGRKPRTKDRHR
jgi:putative Holliday junction resolvase